MLSVTEFVDDERYRSVLPGQVDVDRDRVDCEPATVVCERPQEASVKLIPYNLGVG